MKFLILVALLAYTINSSAVPARRGGMRKTGYVPLPKNLCANYPSGTTFPVDDDCSQFIICVKHQPAYGRCKPSEPYFDRCTSKCCNTQHVCDDEECHGLGPSTAGPESTADPSAKNGTISDSFGDWIEKLK